MTRKRQIKTRFARNLAFVICLISGILCQLSKLNAQVPGGRIEILHANDLQAQRINNEDVQKLKGNVIFRQNDVTMNCDSAILYGARDVLNAFGHVFINQHDSIHLYGNQLDYDGKTKYAIIKEAVKMTDRQMTLLTDRLDYDFEKKEAFYTNGANITDAENKLKSKIGYYFSETRDMYFKKDVVLTNPKFKMVCDTLQYNIVSRKAIFHGPTYITGDKTLVYCETGWYNTETNKAQFGKKAYMKNEKQIIFGDSLYYDRKLSFGKAINNVRIIDTAENLLITGQYAEHYQNVKKTFITNQVLVTKGSKTDSTFLSADTVKLSYDTSGKFRIIRGYYHAKVYNRQFQAICDSIIYNGVDSTIDMRTNPVMWFGLYQATAKRIVIYTKNNKITKADLYQNAFMINEEDSLRYSQIKGRNMFAFFKNGEMNRIDVIGNSEAMYYVRDDKKAYIGLNHITSSDIKISVKESKISRINFIKEPDATLSPMKDVNPSESKLPGFTWQIKARPIGVESLRRELDKPVVLPKNKKDELGKKVKKKKPIKQP